MAIQVVSEPDILSFSGNPIIYKLQSNAHLAVSGVNFSGYIEKRHLTIDEAKISFKFGDQQVVTMSASASPDDSGNQYGFKKNGVLLSSGDIVGYFRANRILYNHYYIGTDIDNINNINISARESGTFYNIESDPRFVVRQMGVDPKEQENFKFLFEIYFKTRRHDPFKKIYSEKISPDNPFTGIATIDISKILDVYLPHDLPSDKFNQVNDKPQYYCRYAEVYGSPAKIREFLQGDTRFIVKGGLSHIGFKTKKLLAILQPDAKDVSKTRFLKQGPRIINVRSDQPEYLSFINLNKGLSDLELIVNILYTDGSSFQASYGWYPVDKYTRLTFSIGPDKLKNYVKVDQTKTISEYTCHIINVGNETVSEKVTYRLDHSYQEHVRYFVYFSSFGSLDTLVTFGRGSQEYELNGQTVNKPQKQNYSLIEGNQLNYNLKLQRTFTVSTGWLEKVQFDALADFFLAEKKWVVKDGIFLPITVTSKKAGDYNDLKSLIAQPFEYRYDFDDHKYTEGDES